MSNLFDKLREKNSGGAPDSSKYGFQGGGHPFRDRPGASTTTSHQTVAASPARRPPPRTEDGDRPPAYQPPAVREEGVVVDWEPPSFGEMLKDLGLRAVEVGIAAAAYAIGEEVAYFFKKRRLFTSEQRRRRDWR